MMIYTTIIRNFSIISDFSEEEGDFQQVLLGVLKANRKPNEFYYISYLNYDFYFLHKDEYTFSCIASPNIDQEKVLLFLNTLRQAFYDIYLKEKESFTLKMTTIIKNLMDQYRENIVNDKFDKIEHELKEIEKDKHEVLKLTLDKDMALDSLITKSDNIKRTSFDMKYQVKKTLNKVKKTNMRFYMTGFMVLLILTIYFFYKITLNFF